MIKKKIIVIGCGFGGLQFIKHLKKDIFDILLIDKVNHHQFQRKHPKLTVLPFKNQKQIFAKKKICLA